MYYAEEDNIVRGFMYGMVPSGSYTTKDHINVVDKTLIKQMEEAIERMEFNRPMMVDIIGA